MIENPVFVYVEDDGPSRMILQLLITRVMKHPHLTVYENSEAIVSKLTGLSPQPSVIFLDIQMKPDDGYEVLKQLRATEQFAHTVVIAMTANVMSHDVEKLKQSGFNGLIGKPIVKDVFPQLVERILEGQAVWFVP